MAISRASSGVDAVASLLRTKRIFLITATRPTASSGLVTRWWARSDSTTVCMISTRISTSSTRLSRLTAAFSTEP